MSEYNCPECKDTGIYQGLNAVEPCRACQRIATAGPPLNLTASDAAFTKGMKQAKRFIDGRGMEWEGVQAGFVPAEIHITATENSILSVEYETQEYDIDCWINLELVYRRISLSQIAYRREDLDEIGKAYLSGEPIKVTCEFPNGIVSSIIATISGWHVTLTTLLGSLSLIEGNQ